MNNILYRHRRSFLHDLAAAVKLTMEWRRAERKQYAANISAQPTKTVQTINPATHWEWTPEACLQYPKHPTGTRKAVYAAFCALDEETRRRLTFAPGDHPGALVGRAKFWQSVLKPSLTPAQYHAAMLTILDWLVWCHKQTKVATMEGIAP